MSVITLHVRRVEGDEILVSDMRVHACGQASSFNQALLLWADMIHEMHDDLRSTVTPLAPELITRLKFLDRLLGTHDNASE